MAVYLGLINDGTFVTADGYRLLDSDDTNLTALPESISRRIIINNVAYRVNVNLELKDGE